MLIIPQVHLIPCFIHILISWQYCLAFGYSHFLSFTVSVPWICNMYKISVFSEAVHIYIILILNNFFTVLLFWPSYNYHNSLLIKLNIKLPHFNYSLLLFTLILAYHNSLSIPIPTPLHKGKFNGASILSSDNTKF